MSKFSTLKFIGIVSLSLHAFATSTPSDRAAEIRRSIFRQPLTLRRRLPGTDDHPTPKPSEPLPSWVEVGVPVVFPYQRTDLPKRYDTLKKEWVCVVSWYPGVIVEIHSKTGAVYVKSPRSEGKIHVMASKLNQSLPHGWVSIWDPKYGKNFYGNSMTRGTQWEHPMPSYPITEKVKVGTKVEALYKPNGRWYPCVISAIVDLEGEAEITAAIIGRQGKHAYKVKYDDSPTKAVRQFASTIRSIKSD